MPSNNDQPLQQHVSRRDVLKSGLAAFVFPDIKLASLVAPEITTLPDPQTSLRLGMLIKQLFANGDAYNLVANKLHEIVINSMGGRPKNPFFDDELEDDETIVSKPQGNVNDIDIKEYPSVAVTFFDGVDCGEKHCL